ncbi:zinc-ribbon domain-containing protein [Loktanella sp. DJP18]|uniref:zinc-ribbon domain-containing protein n=1 Tax=Loktanella sp. DJP18 TaxID=3409788 RepID=UPI003BB4B4DC
MRLICPNCGAQYEVGADVIPDVGRDVQCSNCGHTWFEHPDAPSAAAEELGFVDKPPALSRATRTPPAMTPPAAMPDTEAREPEGAITDAGGSQAGTPSNPVPPASQPAPVRTQLDPSIADILREEAAREEAARKRDATGGLEQQGDLGLTEPPPPPASKVDPVREGRSRVDRLQGRAGAATATAATTGSRKELFPNIDEINSTLRSSAERDNLPLLPAEQAEQSRRSGWRGFLVTLALIVLLAVVYGNADAIAEAAPALADPLASYVAAVDSGRLWLDAKVQSMLGEQSSG